LVLLDVMLPGQDGISVCRDLRAAGWRLPVIMLSAKGEAIDRILGLEIGADDYLVKPFHSRELLARMKAVLRRQGMSDHQPQLKFEHFTIDLHRRQVSREGQVVDLTAKEYDLLLFLANHPGRVWSREQLLQQVWGYDYLGDSRTVDVHIHHLRDKLEPSSGRPQYILTSRGHGYYFREGQ
jgi:DNA-binding response OmpR family regulator